MSKTERRKAQLAGLARGRTTAAKNRRKLARGGAARRKVEQVTRAVKSWTRSSEPKLPQVRRTPGGQSPGIKQLRSRTRELMEMAHALYIDVLGWYTVWDAYMAGAKDGQANPSATREAIGKAGEAWCYLAAIAGPHDYNKPIESEDDHA
jgi:hypothetical protein